MAVLADALGAENSEQMTHLSECLATRPFDHPHRLAGALRLPLDDHARAPRPEHDH